MKYNCKTDRLASSTPHPHPLPAKFHLKTAPTAPMPFLIPLLLEVFKLWKIVLHLFFETFDNAKEHSLFGFLFCTYGFNQLPCIKLYLRMGK